MSENTVEARLLDQLTSALLSVTKDQQVYEVEGTGKFVDLNLCRKRWQPKRLRLGSSSEKTGGWVEDDLNDHLSINHSAVSYNADDKIGTKRKAIVDGLKKRFDVKSCYEGKSSPQSEKDSKFDLLNKIKNDISCLSLALNSHPITEGVAIIAEDEINRSRNFEGLRSLTSSLTACNYSPSEIEKNPKTDLCYTRYFIDSKKLAELSDKVSLLEDVIGIANTNRCTLEENSLKYIPDSKIPFNLLKVLETLTNRIDKISETSNLVQESDKFESKNQSDDKSNGQFQKITCPLLEKVNGIDHIITRIITRLRGLRVLDSDMASCSNLLSIVSQRQNNMKTKIFELRELLETAITAQKNSILTMSKNVNGLIDRIESLSRSINSANVSDNVSNLPV